MSDNYNAIRPLISSPLKRELFERSEGKCANCKKLATSVKTVRSVPTLFDENNKSFEYNHIISPLKGGRTVLANMNILCMKCNRHESTRRIKLTPKAQAIIDLITEGETA